jgi:hypothetical protein
VFLKMVRVFLVHWPSVTLTNLQTSKGFMLQLPHLDVHTSSAVLLLLPCLQVSRASAEVPAAAIDTCATA